MATLEYIHNRATLLIPNFTHTMPSDEGDIDAVDAELVPFEQNVAYLPAEDQRLVAFIKQELQQARTFFRQNANAAQAPIHSRTIQRNPERRTILEKIRAVIGRVLTWLKNILCCHRTSRRPVPTERSPIPPALPSPRLSPPIAGLAPAAPLVPPAAGGRPLVPPAVAAVPPRPAPLVPPTVAPVLPHPALPAAPLAPPAAGGPPLAAPVAALPPPVAPVAPAAPPVALTRLAMNDLPLLAPDGTQELGQFQGTMNQFQTGIRPAENTGVAASSFCALSMLRRLWTAVLERRQLGDNPQTKKFIDEVIREGIKLRGIYKFGEITTDAQGALVLPINQDVSITEAWRAFFPELKLHYIGDGKVGQDGNGRRTYLNELMKLQTAAKDQMIAATMMKGAETHLLLIDHRNKGHPRFYHSDSQGEGGGPGYIQVASTPQALAVHLARVAPYVADGGEANRLQIIPFTR